jgi:pimeloyl-ACP methyl ester carboxylesterase
MVHPDRRADHAFQERILGMFERKNPAIQAAQIRALMDRPDAVDVIAAIRCPALLLSGAQDGFSGPASHAEMADAIPGSQLAIIDHSGHMAPMEQAAAVTAAMRTWLAA